MLQALKQINGKVIFKKLAVGIKGFFIVHISTSVFWSIWWLYLYNSHRISPEHRGRVLQWLVVILAGIVWCISRNRAAISPKLNQGKRSGSFKMNFLFDLAMMLIIFLLWNIISEISHYEVGIVYDIMWAFMGPGNMPDDINVYVWLDKIIPYCRDTSISCLVAFFFYNFTRYFFDKSILESKSISS